MSEKTNDLSNETKTERTIYHEKCKSVLNRPKNAFMPNIRIFTQLIYVTKITSKNIFKQN